MLNHSGQMNIKTGINIKSESLRHFSAIWQKKKDGWETVFFGADNRI